MLLPPELFEFCLMPVLRTREALQSSKNWTRMARIADFLRRYGKRNDSPLQPQIIQSMRQEICPLIATRRNPGIAVAD
jgi:hypothetical protein